MLASLILIAQVCHDWHSELLASVMHARAGPLGLYRCWSPFGREYQNTIRTVRSLMSASITRPTTRRECVPYSVEPILESLCRMLLPSIEARSTMVSAIATNDASANCAIAPERASSSPVSSGDPVRDGAFYFGDGDIVFLVEKTLFKVRNPSLSFAHETSRLIREKVHRAYLTQQGETAFRDMFSMPQPMTPDWSWLQRDRAMTTPSFFTVTRPKNFVNCCAFFTIRKSPIPCFRTPLKPYCCSPVLG